MKTSTYTLTKLAISALVVVFLTSMRPQAQIGDIRMCAAEVEVLTCPIDNPVFETTTTGIYISVDASDLSKGDKLRFTWYYIPKDEFFSDYLGSVYETVTSEALKGGRYSITSTFPKGQAIKPGNYEVVVHPPDGSRPIIKSFKVLD